MDLLSPIVRSLNILGSKAQQTDFLDLENQQTIEREEGTKQSRRRLKQKREESISSGRSEAKQLRTINLDEVAWHDTSDNCWLVIYDFVYDCTDFLKTHPGGYDVILEYAGRDATLAFIGTGHSSMARQSLERYLIGELPQGEKIFRVPNGVKVDGF